MEDETMGFIGGISAVKCLRIPALDHYVTVPPLPLLRSLTINFNINANHIESGNCAKWRMVTSTLDNLVTATTQEIGISIIPRMPRHIDNKPGELKRFLLALDWSAILALMDRWKSLRTLNVELVMVTYPEDDPAMLPVSMKSIVQDVVRERLYVKKMKERYTVNVQYSTFAFGDFPWSSHEIVDSADITNCHDYHICW
jgi:hypothetical protein